MVDPTGKRERNSQRRRSPFILGDENNLLRASMARGRNLDSANREDHANSSKKGEARFSAALRLYGRHGGADP